MNTHALTFAINRPAYQCNEIAAAENISKIEDTAAEAGAVRYVVFQNYLAPYPYAEVL